jgi:hypothetical protein
MPSAARVEHVQVLEIPGWLREYMTGTICLELSGPRLVVRLLHMAGKQLSC